MVRRLLIAAAAATALSTAAAADASATAMPLSMSQGAAFAVLGHWCGGIQEKVYETGFAVDGYPQGNVYMSTRCGGSGRGGGGHVTTYTATATVVWTWLGETWKWGPMVGSLEAIPAEDAHGDRLYNLEAQAYLETGMPPYQPPAPPSNVKASVVLAEGGSTEYLAMPVSWTVDPERAGLITTQTMRAEPIDGSKAPVLEATRIPYFQEGTLAPVEPNTTYRVTVTESDGEGTSAPSTPIDITSPNADGEAERPPGQPACTVDSGTVKLSPGLSETPAVQTAKVTGKLSECEGGPEAGTYTTKFTTTGPVSCGLLTGTEEVTPSTGALSIKWLPAEEGHSTGTITFPLGEGALSGLSGSITGGPFATATPLSTASVFESFTGGPTCGEKVGKKAAKPVKSGVFSTTTVELG
jgi:hypothetical protein